MGSTKTEKGRKSTKTKRDKLSEENQSWLGQHIWLAIIILLLGYIFFLIVPTTIYRIFVNPTFYLNNLYLFYLIDFFSVALYFLIIVPFILGLPNTRRYGEYFQSVRVTRFTPVYRTVVLGLIAAILMLSLMLLSTFLATRFEGQMIFEPSLMIDPSYGVSVYAMLKPGIWEEVAFRGIILVLLMKKYSKKTSIFVNGILFGLFHSLNILTAFMNAFLFEIEPEPGFWVYTLFQIGYTTFFGIFLAYLFIKTESLIPCILTHYLVNAFSSQVTNAQNYNPWIFLIFITVIGFGILPMKLNILIVRASCHTWPQPFDEQVGLFDTFLARKKFRNK